MQARRHPEREGLYDMQRRGLLFPYRGARTCSVCPDGAVCGGVGYAVWPKAGYWEWYRPSVPEAPALCRDFYSSLVVYERDSQSYRGWVNQLPDCPYVAEMPPKYYECENEKWCEGGENRTCAKGHTGVLCAVCDEDFNMNSEGCQPCKQDENSDFWSQYLKLLILIGLVVIIVSIVGWFLYWSYMARMAKEEEERVQSEIPPVDWDSSPHLEDARTGTDKRTANFEWKHSSEATRKRGIKAAKPAEDRIEAIFKHMNPKRNGLMSFKDFKGHFGSFRWCRLLFDLIDYNGTRMITKLSWVSFFERLHEFKGPHFAVEFLDLIEHALLSISAGVAPKIVEVRARQMDTEEKMELLDAKLKKANRLRYGGDDAGLKQGINILQTQDLANQAAGVELLDMDVLMMDMSGHASQLGRDLNFQDEAGLMQEHGGSLEGMMDGLGGTQTDSFNGFDGDLDDAQGCCGAISGALDNMSNEFQDIWDMSQESFEELGEVIEDFYSNMTAVIKIMTSHLQISSSMEFTMNIPWPDAIDDLFTQMSVINLEFFSIVPAGCIMRISYYMRFTFMTITPLLIVGLLGLYTWRSIVAFRKKGLEEKAQATTARGWWIFFIFTYLIYPSVSGDVLAMFSCKPIYEYYYLIADYNEKCYEGVWTSWMIFGLVGVAVYPLGLPYLYFVVMYRNRHRFHLEQVNAQFGFLYNQYEPQCWHYELIEMARKLLLTGVITFFMPETISQIAFAMLISGIFLCVHIHMKAFLDEDDDFLQLVSLTAATLTLFCGILLRAQEEESAASQETSISSGLVEFMLLVVQGGVVIVSVYAMVWRKLIPQLALFRRRMAALKLMLAEKGGGATVNDLADMELQQQTQRQYGIRFKLENEQMASQLDLFIRQISDLDFTVFQQPTEEDLAAFEAVWYDNVVQPGDSEQIPMLQHINKMARLADKRNQAREEPEVVVTDPHMAGGHHMPYAPQPRRARPEYMTVQDDLHQNATKSVAATASPPAASLALGPVPTLAEEVQPMAAPRAMPRNASMRARPAFMTEEDSEQTMTSASDNDE